MLVRDGMCLSEMGEIEKALLIPDVVWVRVKAAIAAGFDDANQLPPQIFQNEITSPLLRLAFM